MFFGRLKGTPSVKNFHLYPSLLHMRAFLKIKKDLKAANPDKAKSVKNTAVFEYMIERLVGETDEQIKEYIEMRKRLADSQVMQGAELDELDDDDETELKTTEKE